MKTPLNSPNDDARRLGGHPDNVEGDGRAFVAAVGLDEGDEGGVVEQDEAAPTLQGLGQLKGSLEDKMLVNMGHIVIE